MEKLPKNNEKRKASVIRELASKAIRAFNTQPLASHGDHFQKERDASDLQD